MTTNGVGLSLLEAAATGDAHRLQTCIAGGCNVNFQHPMNGYSALHWACKRGNIPLVRLLIDCGADPSLRNTDSKTPSSLTKLDEIKQLLPDPTSDSEVAYDKSEEEPKEDTAPSFIPSYLKYPSFPYSDAADIPIDTKAHEEHPPPIKAQTLARPTSDPSAHNNTQTSTQPNQAQNVTETIPQARDTKQQHPSRDSSSSVSREWDEGVAYQASDEVLKKAVVLSYINYLWEQQLISKSMASHLGLTVIEADTDSGLHIMYSAFGRHGLHDAFIAWVTMNYPEDA